MVKDRLGCKVLCDKSRNDCSHIVGRHIAQESYAQRDVRDLLVLDPKDIDSLLGLRFFFLHGSACRALRSHEYLGHFKPEFLRAFGHEEIRAFAVRAERPCRTLFDPALGMSAVIPEMDPTRPANVDPEKILTAIQRYGVTNTFGSPALLHRVGSYGAANDVKLPTLRRVISAGAPAQPTVLERFSRMLPEGTQIHTPYGATEALPVSSIGSRAILAETAAQTNLGRGVCVGLPVEGIDVRVIGIDDDAIATWSDDLEVPSGEVGEFTVKGRQVSRAYYGRDHATALAKIADPEGGFWHRMGDVGYVDEQGRLWFCGRKAHRVQLEGETLYSLQCEGVFNAHPDVYRTALVGVEREGRTLPVLCVELLKDRPLDRAQIESELRAAGAGNERTRSIDTFLFHADFPVDIRHNAKIFREKLAVWATRQLS